MRVLILNNVPAPYFTPLFEKIAAHSQYQITVCYSSDWNEYVGWNEKSIKQSESYRTVILSQRDNGKSFKPINRSTMAVIKLGKLLIGESPDYLICYGYTLKPQMFLLAWAIITRKHFAVIGDANYYTDSVTRMTRLVKRLWLGLLVKRASALITIGTANKLFWESYGAQSEKLFEAKFAVDNDFFTQNVSAQLTEAEKLRSRLGFTSKVIFLFVGRLVKRKNIDLIIRTAVELDDERTAFVIAGSGDELEPLKVLANNHPRIVFIGNITPVELPLFYSLADVLIMPASKEPWGLVINEAMASGLAIIAHKTCGAAVDLVDATNGIKLESFSVNELMEAIKILANDESLLREMQRNSVKKIEDWSIDNAAQGIVRAIEATYQKR